MKISILTENTVYKRGFLAEHGLSILIDTGKKKYLFDTGQSGVFCHNARKLQIDLKEIDGVILSHGHYDHCGGMEFWKELGEVPVYIQEKAFEKKYAENPRNGELRYIGLENNGGWQENVLLSRLSKERETIAQGVHLLSGIPYTTQFEPMPAGFWRSETRRMEPELLTDAMRDEQLLVVESAQGLCVFAGCAHPGIINCLRHVQNAFPGRHLHSLVAGMHLKGSSFGRIQETIQALQELEIDVVVPLHCTGIRAIAAIREALGGFCVLAEVGRQIEI